MPLKYDMDATQASRPSACEYPHTSSREEARQLSKEQNSESFRKTQYAPASWATASNFDLTSSALSELDRRNEETASSSYTSDQQLCDRVAQCSRSEPENHQTIHAAIDFLRHCETTVLQDIKKFARGGGPDLSDLRHFPIPVELLNRAMAKTRPSPRGRIRKSRSKSSPIFSILHAPESTVASGPYDGKFRQRLIDGGIYPLRYRDPDLQIPAQPANWEKIRRRLSERRPSLSSAVFRDEHFIKFQQADADAAKEKQVADTVIPYIRGDTEDLKCTSGGVPFRNLNPLTDDLLVPGNPDIYYGARPEQLHPRVRRELRDEIVPSTEDHLPIAPNFFVEIKGPDGLPAVAKLQACYDGAVGARGMHSLLSYKQEEIESPNNAYTLTSTYCDGVLRIFSTYRTQSSTLGNRPEYFMHELGAWVMTSGIESFRQGAAAYRNGRDWAKEQRDKAVRSANERAG